MTLSTLNNKYPTKIDLYDFALEMLNAIESFSKLTGLRSSTLIAKYNWEPVADFLEKSNLPKSQIYGMAITRILLNLRKEFRSMPESKLRRKIYSTALCIQNAQQYCAEVRVLINQELREIPFHAVEE